MACFMKKGLVIHQDGNLFRIGCGQDIDREMRIQLAREQRRMCQEIDSRQAKACSSAK